MRGWLKQLFLGQSLVAIALSGLAVRLRDELGSIPMPVCTHESLPPARCRTKTRNPTQAYDSLPGFTDLPLPIRAFAFWCVRPGDPPSIHFLFPPSSTPCHLDPPY